MYKQNTIKKRTKGYIPSFSEKGDHRISKNYRSINLTVSHAKAYNALLLNRIRPEFEEVLKKNQNVFRRNRSTTSQILIIRRTIDGVKNPDDATLLFVDFSSAFDSIHRGKMGQILLVYVLPKETVSTIMTLHKNTKATVRSPDGNTDFSDIVARVLQGEALVPYMFIIWLFELTKLLSSLVGGWWGQAIARAFIRCMKKIYSWYG